MRNQNKKYTTEGLEPATKRLMMLVDKLNLNRTTLLKMGGYKSHSRISETVTGTSPVPGYIAETILDRLKDQAIERLEHIDSLERGDSVREFLLPVGVKEKVIADMIDMSPQALGNRGLPGTRLQDAKKAIKKTLHTIIDHV